MTKRTFQTFLFAACSLVLALTVAGCAQNGSTMKADTFTASTQAIQTLDAGMSQKDVYDEAFDKAQSYFPPENPVRGAVIAASLKNKEELSGFFLSLQKNQQYQHIVLLTPFEKADANPGNKNVPAGDIVTTDNGYKTPYGILSPSNDLLSKMNGIKIDDNLAKKEVWPQMLAPFIAKTYPNVSFTPIFIADNAQETELQNLSSWLSTNVSDDTLVLAQTVSKVSSDPLIADFQLKFVKNVMENFDMTKLRVLPLSSPTTIEVLEKYLTAKSAQHMQTEFMDTGSGSFLSFAVDGPLYQSRSAFIVAFGDFMFDRLVRTLMDSHTMDYPFQNMDTTYLKTKDILVANLEGPIAQNRIQTSKTIAFRFKPDIVPLLQKYYFDALSQANNHALDMGVQGFEDTFNFLAPTGIKVFGDPRQIDDKSVATFDVDGQKIAFLGLEEVVYKINDAAAIAKIKDLTSQGYKVIPFMHWGIEYQHGPNSRQVQLGHEFIDAGAIGVIGMHPHVVETFETYKNRPIFYSLGNAVFDQYFSPDTQEGLSTALIISDDQLEIYFIPIKIDHSQFRLMTADERKNFLQKFVGYGDYETEAEREDIMAGHLTIPLSG